MSTLSNLLKDGPIAINLGLEGFAEALQKQDAQVLHVNWSPRPQLDKDTKDLLDQLL